MRKKNHYRPGNSIKRISIAVLTLLCFLVVMRPEAFAGGSKDDSDAHEAEYSTPTPAEDAWDITVIGGHAEDENRNVITSARPGTTVVVIHDGREGHYFTSWIANDSPLPENTPVFKFVMPKHAVEYHAVTTQKQKPGVLDLYISPLTVRENRELFLNALLSFDHYSYPYFDLDRDGNFDLRIQEEEDRILIYKERGYSLGTSYVWNGSYAFLGPITVTTTEEEQPDLIPTLTAGASIEDIPSPYVPTEFPYGSDKVSKTDSGDDGTFNYRIPIIVLVVLGVLGLVILVGVKIKKTPPADSGNNDMDDWRKERVILNAGSGSEIILTESQESSNENEADDSKDGDSE